MIKLFKFLLIGLFSVFAINAYCGTYEVTFWPSVSESNNVGGTYGLYYSPTNSNSPVYVGFCNQGTTNIVFTTQTATDSHTINLNPCNLYVTYAAGTNGPAWSIPYFFDTNNFTAPVTPPPPFAAPVIHGIIQLK
jgi:hypothetical protein